MMLLTTSYDSKVKVFITNFELNKCEIKFDRSPRKLVKLSLLDSSKAISQSENCE